MGELIFMLLILAVCGVCFALTFSFQVSILDTSGGAALWPRFVILFLAIFAVLRIVEILRERKEGSAEPFAFLELFHGPRLFFLLALVGYIVLFKILGYIVTTSLFMVIVMNVFYKWSNDTWGSVRSILVRSGLSVAFAVLLYLFFAKVLKIMLPVGTIWPQ